MNSSESWNAVRIGYTSMWFQGSHLHSDPSRELQLLFRCVFAIIEHYYEGLDTVKYCLSYNILSDWNVSINVQTLGLKIDSVLAVESDVEK